MRIKENINVEDFCDFEVELLSVEKMNSIEYGGQHYQLKILIDLLKQDDIEAKVFLYMLDNCLESINNVASTRFDGTEIIKEKNTYYIVNEYIDKSNSFEDSEEEKQVLESLVSDSANAVAFAISEIGSYDAKDESDDNLTSGYIKDELIEELEIEKGIEKESTKEIALEELILDTITNIEALDETCIMHDINDEFEMTIAEEAYIRINAKYI